MAKNAASTKARDEGDKPGAGGMVGAAVVMAVLVALDEGKEVEDS